jgi:chromosome segregation ATPase
MATATVPEAATPIATLDARITAAQTKVRQIEQRIAEAVEELSSQREQYNGACLRLAGGAHGAADDVETYRARMNKIEAKVSGLRQLLAVPKSELDRASQARAELAAREEEERQTEAVAEEALFVTNKTEAGLQAIRMRDQQQQIIDSIVGNLRTRSYLHARNQSDGRNAASRIERQASGIHPDRA